jgi:hypothetical protein
VLEPLTFDEEERMLLLEKLREVKANLIEQWEAETSANRMRLTQLHERLDRLTDAYIDRLIDKETFEDRKATIIIDRKTLQEKIAQPPSALVDRLSKFLELAGDACLLYQTSLPVEKRSLLKIITSNRTVTGRNVVIALKEPLPDVANRYVSSNGRAYRDRPRTLDALLKKLMVWFMTNPTASFETALSLPRKDSFGNINLKKGNLAA